MRKLLIGFSIFISMLSLSAQTSNAIVEKERGDSIIRVVFYNIENLFDTVADANIADEEFLPTSTKNWDTRKYRTKIANISKTIRAVGGWEPPEIIGLAEIENRSVMLSLAEHPSLSKANLEVLHYDSKDPRGIDVGLLYNSQKVEVLHSEPIKVRMKNSRTRDVLYAKLYVFQKDTLHVFVNHWSSRRGGKDASEYKRIAAANTVKTFTDSIQENNNQANIVVMGDFNDAPTDNSLDVLCSAENQFALVNLMSDLPPTEGSHKYRGVWDYLDQILVSKNTVKATSKFVIDDGAAHVFKEDFLLVEDDRYGDTYPKRTWKGDFFVAGFSDHLPVFCDFLLKR